MPALHRIVCVVIHHHGAEMLSASVRSVLASVDVDVRVVVVSNACDEPLPGWFRDEPRVSVLEPQRELGFGQANNFAVQLVVSSWGRPDAYFFLNNDAALEPSTLGRLAHALGSHPRCGAVGPKILIWGAPDYINSLGLNVTEVAEAWDEGIGEKADAYGDIRDDHEVLALTGAALLVSAEAVEQVGGWSEIYGYYMEDIDLCIRLWSAGWTVRVVPAAVAYHAVSASTGGGISDLKRYYMWRNQYLLMAVHWPLRVLARVLPRFLGAQIVLYGRRRRAGAMGDARLQAKAAIGAVRMAPTALAQRLRRGGRTGWSRFLRKAGTVPVISLPVVDTPPWMQ